MTVEELNHVTEALRERYREIGQNIAKDEAQMAALERTTKLQHGFQKREHARIKERAQVEQYKRDELRLVASRAGIRL